MRSRCATRAGVRRTLCPQLALALSLGLGLGLALAATGIAPAAGIFRWVDENGRVHYGDRPPANAGAPAEIEQVEIDPRSAGSAPSPDDARRRERRDRLLRAFEKERADERAATNAAAREREKLDRECAKLARAVQRASSARYLYRGRTNGERDVLSEEERNAYLKRLEKAQSARRCRAAE